MEPTKDELDALEKLSSMLERDELGGFTPDERERLKQVVKVIRGLEAMAWLGGSLRTFLVWVAAISSIVIAARAGVLDWLRVNL
ncbi:hypothetical protein [Breoghania sp.]|uniref:hypothetical protein n=1 Tax=Breoghania sp. TaxID=2065378 RepID=UPI002AA738E6|nr:hypothetical protein [Breoghania sp.]